MTDPGFSGGRPDSPPREAPEPHRTAAPALADHAMTQQAEQTVVNRPASSYAGPPSPPPVPVPPPGPAGPAAAPAGPAAPAASGATTPRRGPRRATLTVKRVDPWSVLKLSFLYSVALLIVFVVAVAALYAVLSAMGVFDSVNEVLKKFSDSASGDGTGGLQIVFSPVRIIGFSVLLGAVNVVLVTALATLGAFLYNLVADFAGGVEVTLAEQE